MRDVKHNIHRNEHVDTDVMHHQEGDTEVTTVTKKYTHRTVKETTETYSGHLQAT
jgi:hypothetical protein